MRSESPTALACSLAADTTQTIGNASMSQALTTQITRSATGPLKWALQRLHLNKNQNHNKVNRTETAVVVNDDSMPTVMTIEQNHRNRLDRIEQTLEEHSKRLDQIMIKLDELFAIFSDPNFDREGFRRNNQARIEGGQCM
jgi:hypothetical protein